MILIGQSRFPLVLVLAIVIAALAPTSAPGHAAERIPSNLLLFAQEKAKPFRGHLEARRPACRVHRKVKVFRVSNHHLVGTTRATRQGHWFIPGHKPNGSFFAKVGRERTENRGGNITYLCQRDKSPLRHFS